MHPKDRKPINYKTMQTSHYPGSLLHCCHDRLSEVVKVKNHHSLAEKSHQRKARCDKAKGHDFFRVMFICTRCGGRFTQQLGY